jgi:protein-S-isoprenylcysteine O-methyltransferase Ste14
MPHDGPDDTAGIRVLPPLVYLGGLIAGYAIWWFWPVPIVPANLSLSIRIAGGVAVALGVWLAFAAIAAFGRAGTSPHPHEPSTALAVDGPYTFTRNPMYLAMALVLAGLALLGNALWPLLALIPVIVVIRTQVIAKEERYLEAKFGGEYRAFKARVRRWI